MKIRSIAVCALVVAIASSAFAGDSDKACQSAKRKVERERKTLTALDDSIAHEKLARETCISRSACARYDAAIADAERRSVRLAARLSRYESEVAAACS